MKLSFRYIFQLIVMLTTAAGANKAVAQTCDPGNISPEAITIDVNTSPGTLYSNPVGCGLVVLRIEFYSSTDLTNWTRVSLFGNSYTPGPLSQTTWFQYKMYRPGSSGGLWCNNLCKVTVTTLAAGTITPSVSTVNYNQSPGIISGTDATGAQGPISYQWESSWDGANNWTPISGAVSRDYTAGNLTATIYYRRKVTDGLAMKYSNVAGITVYPDLVLGNIGSSQVIHYGATAPTLHLSSVQGGNGSYDYHWYSSSNGSNWGAVSGNSSSYSPGNLTSTMYYKLEVTSNNVTRTSNIVQISVSVSLSSVQPPSVSTGADDPDMNWIWVRTFDEQGGIVGEQKSFFDLSGRPLQAQSRVRFRKDAGTVLTHVFASQSVQDAYGRNALQTLPAPIDRGDFAYKPDFIQDATGAAYSNKNFDRYNSGSSETDKTNDPDPTGSQPGTVGWYYSSNNTWESYTPTSAYPFSREVYYRDGTGNVKKSSGAGEVFKSGSGHEVSSYITPVVNELGHYLQVRNKFFSGSELGAVPATLRSEAIQSMSKDPNGRIQVVIMDKQGNELMTCRPGSDLTVNNTATIVPGGIFYFRTFATGNISISSAVNQLYDMESQTEAPLNIGTGGSIGAGYYKLENTGSNDISVSYSNGYTDVSYNFYNQLGQLVATIAPEGVRKLYGSGLNNYATKNDVPFIELYQYDIQGRLVKSTSTDGGSSEMVYRKDGKLRFSQNAEQKLTGRYSYTNYDKFNRPIESGEYQPDGGGIQFNSDLTAAINPMRDILENTGSTGGLTTGTKTDVITTLYDLPDNGHGITGYTQDAAYLGNGASMSCRYSSIVNNLPNSANMVSANWYNYDEEGKLLWRVRYIKDLGYKTTDYTYDALGRVIKKVYQKDDPAEIFVHYYEYDPATKQLWKVYTNTADNAATKQLQVTYFYYLHGPLKRVELATDLQGIDYTYTLQGALKAINNSDKTRDPSADGGNGMSPDAFGLVLDYFPGDYQNNRTSGIQPIKGVNTSGIGADNYTGHIKAMTWFSRKPAAVTGSNPGIEDPSSYVYQYDDKYQFIESTWGTGINFANTPATFTATVLNKEAIKHPTNGTSAYDANGNILYLQRNNTNGAPEDRFTYNYLNTNTGTGSNIDYNTNKLQSVTDDASGASQVYASYTYDKLGQLTVENTGGATNKYIKYDATGKVILVARDAGFTQKVVEFVYDEQGQRIVRKSYNSTFQLSQITYYTDDVVYTQPVTGGSPGAITSQEYTIQGANGRLGIYFRPNNIYAYELSDHLGNVRAVVAKNGNTMEVRAYTDYYPYGMSIRNYQSAEGYRYEYQGQYAEKDKETDWNAFELRMYDARIGRWLATDPANEYWSPYVNVGNNPVNGTDPTGGCQGCPNQAKQGDYYYEDGFAYQASIINGDAVWAQVQSTAFVDPNYYKLNYDLFLERWQNKLPLIQDGDRASYLANVAMWSKVAQAEAEYWSAQEKVAKFIAWSLVPWGRVAGLAGKGVMWLGSKTLASAGGRVFWSGLGGESSALVMSQAESFAAANGLKTLEMTWAGKALTGIQKTFNIPLEKTLNVWGVLSKMWATGARGSVHVFHDAQGTRLLSQWATIEFPALKDGTVMFFHW